MENKILDRQKSMKRLLFTSGLWNIFLALSKFLRFYWKAFRVILAPFLHIEWGLAILRGCPLQYLMLRMNRKAALHSVKMILLIGNKQLLVNVHKKVTALFCVFRLMSDKTEKHLWVEEIMVQKHHCHCWYQKHPICRDFSFWSSWTCIIYTLLKSYFQWWLW